MDEWVRTDQGNERVESEGRADRGGRSRRNPAAVPSRSPDERRARAGATPLLPADVATEIRRAADTATARHKEVLVGRMESAIAAYDRNRYQEALRLGKQLADEVGSVPAVRRLTGFAAYQLGRWRDALRHLQAYEQLTGELDAAPAIMDCLRALGRHRAVADRFVELRQHSPDVDVLTEARIVAAGSLGDQGELEEAIDLLRAAGAARALRNPSERHLRMWYALGDLYERAGDVPRARELFVRVANVDSDAFDVADRLAALGPEPRRANRARRSRPKSQPSSSRPEGKAERPQVEAPGQDGHLRPSHQ